MSNESKLTVKYLSELRIAADAVTKAQNDHKSHDDIEALKKVATKAQNAYNGALTEDFYALCMGLTDENPVIHLIRQRYIPGTVKVSYKQSAKSGLWSNKLDEVKTKADLVDFAEYMSDMDCGSFGLFPGKRIWWYATQKVSYLLVNAYDGRLTGGNSKFKYDVEDAAKMFIKEGVITDDADLSDDDTMVKILQFIFDSIAEGTVATVRDVTYVTSMMVKQGKEALDVIFLSPDKMAELIVDAMYGQFQDEKKYQTLTQGKGNK